MPRPKALGTWNKGPDSVASQAKAIIWGASSRTKILIAVATCIRIWVYADLLPSQSLKIEWYHVLLHAPWQWLLRMHLQGMLLFWSFPITPSGLSAHSSCIRPTIKVIWKVASWVRKENLSGILGPVTRTEAQGLLDQYLHWRRPPQKLRLQLDLDRPSEAAMRLVLMNHRLLSQWWHSHM